MFEITPAKPPYKVQIFDTKTCWLAGTTSEHIERPGPFAVLPPTEAKI